ncbi:E3 ubiquitin-protein ligase RNF13 isoform X2 [Drosophila busckii]|uniref:E3 ubiquitin-protein ligase RNF13 isoform X2 n=1 Tax=Drosophila busckii TaxID=30019 RepID=UPI00083F4C55|nr:E3 ubiquitin-protein ligase RNF13 isoform X2 [Drosophila busckii]
MLGNRYFTLELTFLLVCLTCHQFFIEGHVLVYKRITNQLIEEFNDLPSRFGPEISGNSLRLFAVPADNTYGCKHLKPPPRTGYPPNAKFVVIISRGGDCTFETKVRVAQSAMYYAVIIYNNEGDELEQMTANNVTGIHTPSVFVGLTTGKILLSFYTTDVDLLINDELPFNINTQLILPFSILIGLCFLIMIVYMIYKCIREQRRQRRYRLPKRMLKKIPVLRYTKNNPNTKYETCVICLEDFVEDDKLRVLPCSHPYHSHCIDPWLTENRRVCPICKRKVFTKGETRASRNRQPSLDSVTDTDDDTTPLLQQQQPTSATPGVAATAVVASGSNSSTLNMPATAGAATTRHGTFRRDNNINESVAAQEQHSSDDENALLMNTSASSSQRRINPFDRSPNLPAHLVNQLNEPSATFWSRLNARLFRRQPASISVAAPAYLEHVESGTNTYAGRGMTATATAAIETVPTSNNILNPNLSGSFKDDDQLPPHRSIYEPIAAVTPGTEQQRTPSIAVAAADSAFLQTPTQGGIGVAALPPHSSSDLQFLI